MWFAPMPKILSLPGSLYSSYDQYGFSEAHVTADKESITNPLKIKAKKFDQRAQQALSVRQLSKLINSCAYIHLIMYVHVNISRLYTWTCTRRACLCSMRGWVASVYGVHVVREIRYSRLSRW